MKLVRILPLLLVALLLAMPAQAETKGWGVGLGIQDGDFSLQGRKDFWLGGDVSQITGQFGVQFANSTVWRLDADYHFVIKSGKSRLYPLAGLDFAFNSDSAKFGINAGGGVNFMLTDKTAAFAEIKYIFSDWDMWSIMGGIYF